MSEMNTIDYTRNPASDPDEILTAFAGAGASADLADWMRRYPALRGDLAHAAAARWAGESVPSGAAGSPDEAASTARVRAIGRETLLAFRAGWSPTVAPAALAGLVSAARERGVEPATLAHRLQIPYAVFVKLHRRLIAPDSVPMSLLSEMGAALNRTVDDIAAYLRQPPALALGASYRSDTAPRAGTQETFDAALRSDPETTDEQRARYLTGDGS